MGYWPDNQVVNDPDETGTILISSWKLDPPDTEFTMQVYNDLKKTEDKIKKEKEKKLEVG